MPGPGSLSSEPSESLEPYVGTTLHHRESEASRDYIARVAGRQDYTWIAMGPEGQFLDYRTLPGERGWLVMVPRGLDQPIFEVQPLTQLFPGLQRKFLQQLGPHSCVPEKG